MYFQSLSFYFSYLYPRLQTLYHRLSVWSPSVCLFPSLFPLGGKVYLFDAVSKWKVGDWKADSHRWENNETSDLPRTKLVVTKTYYQIKTAERISKTFKTDVFILYGSHGKVRIHYLGDESVSKLSPPAAFKEANYAFFSKPSLLPIKTCKK